VDSSISYFHIILLETFITLEYKGKIKTSILFLFCYTIPVFIIGPINRYLDFVKIGKEAF
jgi:D-alanyl-lipoteichoic acid acyltransferase DltB (MBOAT superfamily)